MNGPWWTALRWLFLAAVALGAYLSWHESGPEVAGAMAHVSLGQVVLATALVYVGLALTGPVWLLGVRSLGGGGGVRQLLAMFFVGQLGKYVPGSVWSFGAQMAMARRAGLSARVVGAGGVTFLLVHLASGLVVAGPVGMAVLSLPQVPRAVLVAANAGMLVAGAMALAPPTVRRLSEVLGGERCAWGPARSARALGLMLGVWAAYVAAVVVLVGDMDARTIAVVAVAFPVAHAAGVLVPVAPAGLGAREGVLVLLLAPVAGVVTASAVAIMVRLVHTVADLLVAGSAWLVARH